MDIPDDMRCKYNGGVCPHPRATRHNGRTPLRVCEFHRRRANAHQMDYQRRRRRLARATASNWVGAQAEFPSAAPTPAQPTPSSVTPAKLPRVVFVLASENEIGESLRRLSTAADLSVGQPFEVVPAGHLTEFLRRIGTDQAVDELLDTVTLQPDQVKQEADDLDPLRYDTGVEEFKLLLLEDEDEFVSSLLDEESWINDFLM